MANPVRRVGDYVDALLRDRRPPRLKPDPEELAVLRQATAMSSLRTGSDAPQAEFVADLRRRLRSEMEGTVRLRPRWSRRAALQGVGAAAVAIAAGVAFDRAASLVTDSQPQALQPNNANWVAVGNVSEVSYGSPLRFRAGAVEGFVFLDKGQLRGISAVCTHQGCLLEYKVTSSDLECPCHRSTFATSGEVVSHQLPSAPRHLPSIGVRQRGESIEVLVV